MKLRSVFNRVTDKIIDRLVVKATAEAGSVTCRCVYNPVVCASTTELLCRSGSGPEHFSGCSCD